MDTRSSLTSAQKEVLQFIRECCEQQGGPPSYREIQARFGYKAVGTVQDHVNALIKKGYLERSEGKARGLLPTGFRIEGVKRIPIYGEIAAGSAREATQIELGALVITNSMAKDPCFALRVVGDSMIEAGILEGDYVIVERGSDVQNGDIVVALLNGETTVKRYQLKADGIYLIPENRLMKPIYVAGRPFEIQGRVVGLQRKL